MNKIKYTVAAMCVWGGLALAMPSCVDFSYNDIEPREDSTTLEANTTIAELKVAYPGTLCKITNSTFAGRDSVIIAGRIISSDREGNIYKSLFIEDGTAAIEIKLNKTTLYNDYKLGQMVVVYCNGLHLGDYGGQIQLGSSYLNNGVPELGSLEGDVIIAKHLFRKGSGVAEVAPLVLTAALLHPASIGRLVQLDNVQIKDTLSPITGLTYTYADAVNRVTINHQLVSATQAFASTIVLRTSGYARFAGTTINTRQGTVVGILTYYNGTYQLLVRSLDDVKFNQPRFQI